MQPKSDAKVKTILHRHAPLLCHIQGQSFKQQVLSQHWYHAKRLRVSETETHSERHTKNNNSYGHRRAPWKAWFIKSSHWPCEEGTVKVRRCTPQHLWQYHHSFFSRAIQVGWGESQRFQIGFIWFPRTHFGFSGANWKRSHLSKHFLQTGTRSVSPQYEPRQPLFTLAGIPRHKMRFIIIYEAGCKIADTNCSWHKFFELLSVGFFWFSFSLMFHHRVAIDYKHPSRTISQPLLFGFVDSQKRTVTPNCHIQ